MNRKRTIIIAEYNKDKDDAEIQRVFEALFRTHEALNDEEMRYLREGFKDDQSLAVFDLLSKDIGNLNKADLAKIKKVAQALMDTIVHQLKVMGNLRDRASSQAQGRKAY